MNYIKPTSILYKTTGNKKWVEVYFGDETKVWIPSLIDLAEILGKIGVCEDEKYDFPARKVKGAEMVGEFISDVVKGNFDEVEDIKEIAKQYMIPTENISKITRKDI